MSNFVQASERRVSASDVKSYLRWIARELPKNARIIGELQTNKYENSCTFSINGGNGGLMVSINTMLLAEKGGRV